MSKKINQIDNEEELKNSSRYQLDNFLNSDESHNYKIDAIDISILYTITYYIDCNQKGLNACFAKQATLAQRARLNRKTINLRIEKLANLNLICTERRWKLLWITLGKNIIELPTVTGEHEENNLVVLPVVTRSSYPELLDQVTHSNTTIEHNNKNIRNKEYKNKKHMSVLQPTHVDEPENRFEEFWKAYPRKENKKKAQEIWKRKKLNGNADFIIQDIHDRQRRHQSWLKGYIPHATTYLNGERWNDEITENENGKGGAGFQTIKPEREKSESRKTWDFLFKAAGFTKGTEFTQCENIFNVENNLSDEVPSALPYGRITIDSD